MIGAGRAASHRPEGGTRLGVQASAGFVDTERRHTDIGYLSIDSACRCDGRLSEHGVRNRWRRLREEDREQHRGDGDRPTTPLPQTIPRTTGYMET